MPGAVVMSNIKAEIGEKPMSVPRLCVLEVWTTVVTFHRALNGGSEPARAAG